MIAWAVLGIVCVGGIAVALHRQARTATKADPVDALLQAAVKADLWTLTYLLDRGVDIDASSRSAPGITALHGAVMSGSCDCVELLLRRGAKLETHPAADASGHKDTPLAYAVSQACDSVAQKDGLPGEEPTEMVELLLAAGADPEPGLAVLRQYHQTDEHEQTPLASLLRAAKRRAPR